MIRQYVGVALMAMLMAVLQTALLPSLGNRAFVDFLFVMVVIIGLEKDPVRGSAMSALIGWLEDVMAGQVTGLFMTARVVTFMLAQYVRVRLAPDNPAAQFAIGLGLGISDRVAVATLGAVFVGQTYITFSNFLFMVMGTLINAAMVPLFYYLFRLVPGFLEVRRGPVVTR